ncbi:uncharacterized protein V1518DRAFT_436326 [Limtongia smithiae]|uniref:uncharacterized protein n=1 Tax=Limtongia smithiae TaxID=1125753 RepID=UPI0034CE1672
MSTAQGQSSPPLPPHTVRIKRKRNQDPLQALLLGQDTATKRSRTNSYVFKLAATEEQPRRAGAITLLEGPAIASQQSPAAVTASSSSFLQSAREILNPARLFHFPTRKRQISESADVDARQPQSKKAVLAADIVMDDQPMARRPRTPEIPKVKVLGQSPPRRSIISPVSRTIPIQDREAKQQRRRRSSTMSLSPSGSYQAMPTSKEDELQKMVDSYLQLNHDNEEKPMQKLKRPHAHHAPAATRDVESGTASPALKTRHLADTQSQFEAQARLLNERLESTQKQAPTSDDVSGDVEVEDYVYDVYYREKLLGDTWSGGQYGLL